MFSACWSRISDSSANGGDAARSAGEKDRLDRIGLQAGGSEDDQFTLSASDFADFGWDQNDLDAILGAINPDD